jgi:membrane fusion protein, macrolide-specific efflux system
MPENATHEAVGIVTVRGPNRDDIAPADGPLPPDDPMSAGTPRHRDGVRTRLGWVRGHPWLAGGVVVVVLAGAGTGVYFGTRGASPVAAATTTVDTVSTGTIKQSVSATGTLAPAHEESLNFSTSGQVTSVKVKAGDTVKKGQTLATIESASLASAVAQAKATVAADQAKVDDDADASSTQLAADKAALTAAKNQLTAAKAQLAAATMTSPIDGAVAEVNIATGDSVSGSSSSSSASSSGSTGSFSSPTSSSSSSSSSSSAQILVISTNSWIVNATVDATSVGLIKTSDQAQLTVSGSDATVYGTISSIGLVSSSSSGTASYPVVIAVTGSPAGLHDGASVTATLIYKQLSNVVVISATALHRDANGEYVEKQVSGRAVRTAVQVGVQSGTEVQITSGLAAGDKIVVPQIQRPSVLSTGRAGTGNGGGGFPGGGNFPGGGFPGGGNGGFPGGGGFGG